MADKILSLYTRLKPDDVRPTPMGVNGPDVMLSPAAQRKFKWGIECKNQEAYKRIYTDFNQAIDNTKKNQSPLLIVKMNRKEPLAVITAERFFELLKEVDDGKRS